MGKFVVVPGDVERGAAINFPDKSLPVEGVQKGFERGMRGGSLAMDSRRRLKSKVFRAQMKTGILVIVSRAGSKKGPAAQTGSGTAMKCRWNTHAGSWPA